MPEQEQGGIAGEAAGVVVEEGVAAAAGHIAADVGAGTVVDKLELLGIRLRELQVPRPERHQEAVH